MDLRKNDDDDNRIVPLVDPFKASLALSIHRRREQNNAASNLYAMPAVQSQRSPPMTRRNRDVGYSPSLRVPTRRIPSPIRRVPIMDNPVEPAFPRRPSYTHSPTHSLRDTNREYRHSMRSPARSPSRRDGLPEPASWYRPSLPANELHTLPPDSPPHSLPSRPDSEQENDGNNRTMFDLGAQNPVSTTPPIPGTRSVESLVSRPPSPVHHYNNSSTSVPKIISQPTHIPGNEYVVQTTEHENKWGPGWGPIRTEPEQDSEEVQEKGRCSNFISPARRSSRRSITPLPDEPWCKEYRKGPSTALHRQSTYSISKRASQKSFPDPQPSAPKDENRFPADLEAGQKQRHPDVETYLTTFVLDTAPRQVYLHCHLRLPYMYFSRISRIFRAAGLSVEDIKEGMLDTALRQQDLRDESGARAQVPDSNTTYDHLQKTWNALISSLISEWNSLNIISALLLAAILTLLQIDTASSDPLPRYTGFASMICALISLLCGYIYIIRFDSMRNSYKVVEWANELQSSRTGIWWNIWIFLALPATWLAWSIILYLACAMSLIWRSGTAADTNRSPMTPNQALAGRVCLTVLLAIAVVYLILVILTLRHFGDQMDEAWQRRLSGWVGDAQRERAAQRVQEPVLSRRATRRQLTGESPEHSVERAYRYYYPPPPRPPHLETPVHTIQMLG